MRLISLGSLGSLGSADWRITVLSIAPQTLQTG
jgi:hypothetical protein